MRSSIPIDNERQLIASGAQVQAMNDLLIELGRKVSCGHIISLEELLSVSEKGREARKDTLKKL